MTIPQGLITFSGLAPEIITSASFAMGHGTGPSCATIYCAARPVLTRKIGTLRVAYGGQWIDFHDCCIDRIERQVERTGFERWSIHVLDRRWRWKYAGRVSGYYNVRRDGGVSKTGLSRASIDPATQASPRELAAVCLRAMGEERFDLSRMPDELRPAIEWDYTLPADALGQLCDLTGCRVVLQLNGRVAIEPAGRGASLPMGADLLDGGHEIDAPEIPDEIVVVSAHARWQVDLELEAVGRELDGTVRPIDELSYAPTVDGKKTWQYADSFFNCVERKHRAVAQETVFRWYRIKPPGKLYTLYGRPFEVTNLARILPIEDRQIETTRVDKRIEPRPAWVYGVFHAGKDGYKPEAIIPEADLEHRPEGLYVRGFSLDRELGIVRFSEPVYQIPGEIANKGGEIVGGYKAPANLRLRTSISVRDERTRGWMRCEFRRKLSGARSEIPARYIVQDDVAANIVQIGEELLTNHTDADRQATYYLDAAERSYRWDVPGSASYAGLKAVELDGAIQSVTWSVSEDGYAETKVNRNREDLARMPSYQERRLLERLQEVAAEQRRGTAAQRAEHARKGKG